jgi:spermidine/putrescine-binding protein
VVNTDAVETLPQSFADLWKPEYAGRLIMLDDSRAIIGATLLTLGYDVNTTDPAQLEEAKVEAGRTGGRRQALRQRQPEDGAHRRRRRPGHRLDGRGVAGAAREPGDQYIYPTEGPILWQDNYAIPVDAPHVDAAYAWLNYSMQPMSSGACWKSSPTPIPTWPRWNLPRPITPSCMRRTWNSNITNTPAEVIANGHRIEDVGEATPLYDQVWTEVKGE